MNTETYKLLLYMIFYLGDATAYALTAEVPGKAEIIGPLYLDDAEKTQISYANVNHPCSGIMIGPNILMTAAHCGHGTHGVIHQVYRNRSKTQVSIDENQCWYLLQTLPSNSDLMLLYCPNINGIPPGIKYGYLDLENTPVLPGQTIYSFWLNSVYSPPVNGRDAVLFSSGYVDNINTSVWDGWGNIGVTMNAWAREGASGSAHINPSTGRVIIGPLVAGTQDPAGSNYRLAIPMDYYLNSAVVDIINDTNNIKQINVPGLTSLGIDNADSFYGLLNKDRDLIFDIQKAVEQQSGESQRDYYWMGFESPRRNGLWNHYLSPYITTEFRPMQQNFIVKNYDNGHTRVLWHDDLHLKPNREYHVSLRVNVYTPSTKPGLAFKYLSNNSPHKTYVIPTNKTGWQRHTFDIRTGAGAHTVRLDTREIGTYEISDVVIRAKHSLIDFDTHDVRISWRHSETQKAGFIIPDGTASSASEVDWAGYVGPRSDNYSKQSWLLESGNLAILPKRMQQICFKYKQYTGLVSGSSWAKTQLSNGNVTYTEALKPNNRWQSKCTRIFTVHTGNSLLKYGLNSNVESNQSYLIDDVIVKDSSWVVAAVY